MGTFKNGDNFVHMDGNKGHVVRSEPDKAGIILIKYEKDKDELGLYYSVHPVMIMWTHKEK